MINLSELQSNIKNIEMICPRCLKYDICFYKHFNNRSYEKKFFDFNFFIKILKKIYNNNPKCSNNLNCLNLELKWCTNCYNWFCEKCSKTHICDIKKKKSDIYSCSNPSHPKLLLSKNNINYKKQNFFEWF